MYGRLNTAEKRQENRKYYLDGCKITEYPEHDAVIGISDNAKFTAIAFSGTKGKPDFYYNFRTPEAREKYISDWLESLKRSQQYKEERKNKRKAPALSAVPFKPSDILYDSWGYDQTNVDFYEVVEVKTASAIVIRQIAQDTTDTGFMSGHTTPRPGEYTEEPQQKRVQWYDGRPYIKSEYGSIGKWDGDPVSCSWYA